MLQKFCSLGYSCFLSLAIMDTVFAAPNVIVTTDIGGDPDDSQSMRRLMLYANEFHLLGLVASATGTPNDALASQVRPDLIRNIIDDYSSVYPNLRLHSDSYPAPDYLRSIVKAGNPNRGTSAVGPNHDTEGSNWIVSQIEAANEPVAVTIWGGATELAQAFYRVRSDRSKAETELWVSKVRIYAIHDQDGLNHKLGDQPSTLAWIRTNFPEVWMIEAGSIAIMPSGYQGMYRGMYQNDSAGGGAPAVQLVEDENIALNQSDWMKLNVLTEHGKLGAGFPLTQQNPGTPRNLSGDKEGDTPSWFYFLPNGLSDPSQPGWGCWGGRAKLVSGSFHVDAEDDHWSGTEDAAARRKWTVARWRRDYQLDLAARMDWCVKSWSEANHNPIAVLNGDKTRKVILMTAAPGSVVRLSSNSSDPDNHPFTCRWWVYREAGTYSGNVVIEDDTFPEAKLTMPADSAGKTIHIILEVTDTGSPSLTAYRRLVVTGEG